MTEGYKKAALRIHCLCESDRRWLLGMLPEQERMKLNVYLTELGEMKIPDNAVTFSDLMNRALDAYVVSQVTDISPTYTETVSRIDSSTAIKVLTREPDWLIALALRIDEWSWAEAFIRSLDQDRRTRIFMLVREIPSDLPPKLRDSIIQLMAQAFTAERPNTVTDMTSGIESLFMKLGVDNSGASKNRGHSI